jgi:hypothetical protein
MQRVASQMGRRPKGEGGPPGLAGRLYSPHRLRNLAELRHNVRETWPLVRQLVPASLHQVPAPRKPHPAAAERRKYAICKRYLNTVPSLTIEHAITNY